MRKKTHVESPESGDFRKRFSRAIEGGVLRLFFMIGSSPQ
jgi:hypothetical protein